MNGIVVFAFDRRGVTTVDFHGCSVDLEWRREVRKGNSTDCLRTGQGPTLSFRILAAPTSRKLDELRSSQCVERILAHDRCVP